MRLLLLLLLLVPTACTRTVDAYDEPPMGTGEAFVNGEWHKFNFRLQRNAYEPGQFVLQGFSRSLPTHNLLMLTFSQTLGIARINYTMTGYWNLSFCRPGNRFLPQNANAVQVRIEETTPGHLRGTFSARVASVAHPDDILVFTDGTFDVPLYDRDFAFCSEG